MVEKLYDKKAIRKQIYFLIIPIMLENMFQVSAGLVSSAMIGRLTPSLIASQGIGSRITGVLWCLFKGIGIGATVIIAKSHGEGNMDKCKKTFEHTIITGIVVSIIIIILVLMNLLDILSFFTSSIDTIESSSRYIKISIGVKYLIAMGFIQIPQNLSKVLNGTIRSAGYKNIPMII